MDPVDLGTWALAVAPIPLLVLLVVQGRWATGTNAAVSVATALVIGIVTFGAGPSVLGVALGKGVWTGIWILYVIWTAMLLYQLAAQAGLTGLGDVLSSVLPRETENVLLLAWVFPAFIQGVAGFGTPIAVAAPLLYSMGVGKVRAVVLPLVGYHWAVTFGSMGSSFYMGALTAGLSPSDTGIYARDAAFLLGCNMLLAGVLVALLHAGWRGLRGSGRMLATVGGVMFIVLNMAVRVEPSIGSLSAGAAGLSVVVLLRLTLMRTSLRTAVPVTTLTDGSPEGAEVASPDPSPRRPVLVLLPYAVLLVSVLAMFLPPATRSFAKNNLLLGPSFPETATATGTINPPVDLYTPIALLGHPGSFLLFSSIVGLWIYHRTGLWPSGSLRPALADWFTKVRRSSFSVIALTTLAAIMVDTGMVRTIASGAASVTGTLYPLVAPVIGALGSFTTGSTTTSNALFSALQGDVAQLIGVGAPKLVAAQTVGGNVGNSVAPVIILVGATSLGTDRHLEGQIFRRTIGLCAILLVTVSVLVTALIAVTG